MGANFSQSRCINFGVSQLTETLFNHVAVAVGYNKPPFNPRKSNNKRNERNGYKQNMCFRYGSENHFIANCTKLDTLDNEVHWNT